MPGIEPGSKNAWQADHRSRTNFTSPSALASCRPDGRELAWCGRRCLCWPNRM